MPAQLARWATTSRYSDGTASAPGVAVALVGQRDELSRNDSRPVVVERVPGPQPARSRC